MLDKLDKAIIRKLQKDLPLVSSPFKSAAEELGIGEEELLDRIRKLSHKRILRRLGAVLHHRNAGFAANAMVIWNVPENQIDEAANRMSAFPWVSHCYQRTTFPGWPYNLFTMVHAKSLDECEGLIAQAAEAVQIQDYEVLYSQKELKKSSMKYFYSTKDEK